MPARELLIAVTTVEAGVDHMVHTLLVGMETGTTRVAFPFRCIVPCCITVLVAGVLSCRELPLASPARVHFALGSFRERVECLFCKWEWSLEDGVVQVRKVEVEGLKGKEEAPNYGRTWWDQGWRGRNNLVQVGWLLSPENWAIRSFQGSLSWECVFSSVLWTTAQFWWA